MESFKILLIIKIWNDRRAQVKYTTVVGFLIVYIMKMGQEDVE